MSTHTHDWLQCPFGIFDRIPICVCSINWFMQFMQNVVRTSNIELNRIRFFSFFLSAVVSHLNQYLLLLPWLSDGLNGIVWKLKYIFMWNWHVIVFSVPGNSPVLRTSAQRVVCIVVSFFNLNEVHDAHVGLQCELCIYLLQYLQNASLHFVKMK